MELRLTRPRSTYAHVAFVIVVATYLPTLVAQHHDDEGESLDDVAVADVVVDPGQYWDTPYCVAPFQSPLSLQLDYLLWWLSGNSLPPLVTTGPVAVPPVLGLPGTSVLFGNDEVDAGVRGGFRGTLDVRLAHWLDTHLELEGQLTVLGNGQKTGDFYVESTGVPVLGRPFFNVQTNSQDQLIVAAPGLAFPDPVLGVPDPTLLLDEAQIQTDTTSDLVAVGMLLRGNWVRRRCVRYDLLGGYRYMRFQEDFVFYQFQSFSDPTDANRTGDITLVDSFSTSSEFHGFDIGLESRWRRGAIEIDLLTKLSIGNMHQELKISGSNITNRPDDGNDDTPDVFENDYGFLTAPSNIGRYSSDQFGVVPELGITLRYSLTRTASLTVGYNLIALPNVLRSGDQIDTAIDPSQVVPRPSATLEDSTLLIQGVNVGLEF